MSHGHGAATRRSLTRSDSDVSAVTVAGANSPAIVSMGGTATVPWNMLHAPSKIVWASLCDVNFHIKSTTHPRLKLLASPYVFN